MTWNQSNYAKHKSFCRCIPDRHGPSYFLPLADTTRMANFSFNINVRCILVTDNNRQNGVSLDLITQSKFPALPSQFSNY